VIHGNVSVRNRSKDTRDCTEKDKETSRSPAVIIIRTAREAHDDADHQERRRRKKMIRENEATVLLCDILKEVSPLPVQNKEKKRGKPGAELMILPLIPDPVAVD